jgi:hypothetical protein
MWRAPVIFVLMMVAFALAAPPQVSRNNAPADQGSATQVQRGGPPVAFVFEQQAVEPAIYKRPCQNTDEDRQSDLCAHWNSVDWTKTGTIVAIIGIMVLLFQVKIGWEAVKDTGDATEAMREGNKIARDSADVAAEALKHAKEDALAQSRPWIAINAVLVSGLGPANRWRITLAIQLTNVGNVPATHVHPRMWVNTGASLPGDSRLNEELLIRQAKDMMRGDLVVPKEVHSFEMSTDLDVAVDTPAHHRGMFCPSVTLACFYRSARSGDDTIHYTMKTYNFALPGGGGWLQLTDNHPAGRLSLVPDSGGANKAT